MQKTIESKIKTPTSQELYDEVNGVIADIEDDAYDIEAIINLIANYKKFLEVNHTVM